jgi:hypothetical protein
VLCGMRASEIVLVRWAESRALAENTHILQGGIVEALLHGDRLPAVRRGQAHVGLR